MSQPEGQCHTGTSQVSQMIWMADRISSLEDKLAAADSGIARLAQALDLEIPQGCEPVQALLLDIKRLQDVNALWNEACALARTHCPVRVGESHIRQGIPRLAHKYTDVEAQRNEARKLAEECLEYADSSYEGESEMEPFCDSAIRHYCKRPTLPWITK